jgi:serine/threonine-protein kinase
VLNPGDKIKDYEIIAPIRSGGMAMLYLARRRGVGGFRRLVALKLVHSHLIDDPNINRLFLQEARIAASVAHPNVVHVEEVGSADGKYFIAMEYVHGVSLDQFLTRLSKQRRRMSAKLCIWIAAQIGEALHAVHEATLDNGVPLNIVHRDVSPQNVLIGHTGHIKLIDFGIAKSQLMSYQASRGGSVLGKLRYMAPEQLQLLPVNRRTDVYALGVMLWEMLAARNLLRCFRIDDERDWATRERPPPPSKHAGNLTRAVDQAVLKALACDPEARYENALVFRRALLRAEPNASLVDAPAFAALINHLIGDELAQRRANFPNEVNVQLESDVISAAEPSLGLEELTARLKPSEDSDPQVEDDPDEPTRQASFVNLDDDPADDQTVVRTVAQAQRALLHTPTPPRASTQALLLARRSPQAMIPTYGLPASHARASTPPGTRDFLRRGVPHTAALALFVALSAYLAAFIPRATVQLVAERASAGPLEPSRGAQPVTQSRPARLDIDRQRPLTLRETAIVSAPAAPTRAAQAAPPSPALRRLRPAPLAPKAKKRLAVGALRSAAPRALKKPVNARPKAGTPVTQRTLAPRPGAL